MKFTRPIPRPPSLYAVRDKRFPVSAVDDHGHDVLPLLLKQDGRYPAGFQRNRILGMADLHSLTLDLGKMPANCSRKFVAQRLGLLDGFERRPRSRIEPPIADGFSLSCRCAMRAENGSPSSPTWACPAARIAPCAST